jgi:tetrahydromethanopterin S-methyltransferase subunit G
MDQQQPNKQVVDYFMQVTHEKFYSVEKKLERIENKVEQLIGFRWMLIGMAAAVSALVEVAFKMLGKA